MKVYIGTEVWSDFGKGPIVAMTKQWCIHVVRGDEVAIPWDEVSLEAEPVDAPKGGESVHEVED